MSRMRAVVTTGLGGPEVLQVAEVSLGWPARGGDVLVRLAAAGLNPADGFFRALGPYVCGEAPLILGHDGAGVVEAVGADVASVAPGDRVCFCHGGIGAAPGTYAEFAVVPEALLAKLPAGVDYATAAAFPLVAITAWEALVDRAGLGIGETSLIHAGAGGTGQMAIQIARLRGARVATTVSTAEKAALAASLGAERTILYPSEDFVAAARDWTGGAGVDVALDNVGAETMVRSLAAMAPYGRVVTLMGTPADDAQTRAYNLNLTIHNVMMLTPMWLGLGDRLRHQAAILCRLMPLLARGEIGVRIARRFPLAEAAAAHRLLDEGGLTGKIVLEIPG